jgi:hypothetical protein
MSARLVAGVARLRAGPRRALPVPVIFVEHSQPQKLGQQIIDPLDGVEPTKHRDERWDEPLADSTVVSQDGPLRTALVARACYNLPMW